MNLRWALTEVMLEIFRAEDFAGLNYMLAIQHSALSTALTISYGRWMCARIPDPWG